MVPGLILVTGGRGQLATALGADPRVRVVGRPLFELDRPETIEPLLDQVRPAAVINAAAYTAVDRAETEPEAAFQANRDGPAMLAAICARHGIGFVHVSTDYVFDGTKGAPYAETDPASPLGVYGQSKRAGEVAVLAAMANALVIRTSWVYAGHGHNFVLTMLNAARSRPRLRVVADQRGRPTYAPDLARAVLQMTERMLSGDPSATGLLHAAGGGETTWHGFAEAIFAEAGRRGLPAVPVDPIGTAEWPTPVRRPADSRLACDRLAAFGFALPPWPDALARMIGSLGA